MAEIITATYENGVLRPLRPLNLRERQTVRLQILPEEPSDEVEEVVQLLVKAGLLTPPSGHSEFGPVSEEKRRELAESLGQEPGDPLSEIIIDERGEW
jgi:predicted DNA-binding antitoxin AbrB/MazE fold protein